MNNHFTLLRSPNALRCRFAAASGILKQLEYKHSFFTAKATQSYEGFKISFLAFFAFAVLL
ncbi:MAG: hypothetical protein LBJ00_06100 [Planctomycetaceae bacterium]|nr:hypothetical protein [Planctomycetaceae bacterium]